MAGRGNKPLKKDNVIDPDKLHCLSCNNEFDSKEFYSSDSVLYKAVGKIPYCSECLDEFYQGYLNRYTKLEYSNPEKKAIERLCMALDVFYSDKIFDSALKLFEEKASSATLFAMYLKQSKLYQYRNKNYDTTIGDKFKIMKDEDLASSVLTKQDKKQSEIAKKAEKFFGSGFSDSDYVFLYEQYQDWTTRHECQTKSQEEVFKQICFTQLDILKAQRAKEDTKDLVATFQKLLETAKLQPKQNSNESISDAQTFGTLIDKWENTRPIPEIDEDLKDVDKIGKYINIFFKGHLSKMMGFKNAPCKAYDDFIKQYSVQKPEYESDENDSEALFDALFGGDLDD